MLENVKLSRYNAPTPIQSYCIPAVLTGHDVVAIAQTGEFPISTALHALTAVRFRKDRSVPDSNLVEAHG
jgi:superfamily II DNA/RNA helicase